MKNKIGKCRLPELLERRGWTQLDLSYRTKIASQQISTYARNEKVMSLPTARVIAGALGCCIDDLYDWLDSDD